MRHLVLVVSIASALASLSLGCGAAPGYEETTPTAELAPLRVGQPEARLVGTDGVNANFEIAVVVSNPNDTPMTMRRIDGHVFLNEQDVAHVEVEGAELVDAQSERRFVLQLAVPLSVLVQLRAEQYVARGTLYADAGSGEGSTQSPFEFSGAVPR